MPQKEISGILTFLWQRDPFKAKWTIIAKSYSLIRDQKGKENAPLDEYLMVVTVYLKMIAPGEYLEQMGWEVAVSVEGKVGLSRVRDVTFERDVLACNVSVEDVIEHCYNAGYIAVGGSNVVEPRDQPVLSMTTSLQSLDAQWTENQYFTDSAKDHGFIIPGVMNRLGDSTHGSGHQTSVGASAGSFQPAPGFAINNATATQTSTFSGPVVGAMRGTPSELLHYSFNPFQGDAFDAFNMSGWPYSLFP